MHATFLSLRIAENYHELKPNGQLQLTRSFDSPHNEICLNARVEWKNPLQMLAFFCVYNSETQIQLGENDVKFIQTK